MMERASNGFTVGGEPRQVLSDFRAITGLTAQRHLRHDQGAQSLCAFGPPQSGKIFFDGPLAAVSPFPDEFLSDCV